MFTDVENPFNASTKRGGFVHNEHKWPLSRLFGLKRLTPTVKEVLSEERCAFQRPRKRLALCDRTKRRRANGTKSAASLVVQVGWGTAVVVVI